MIDLYEYFVSHPAISINGYHAAVIKNMYTDFYVPCIMLYNLQASMYHVS